MAFAKNFLWGVAGAAEQQDGAYLDDGKGLNIWEALSAGHIKNNDTPFVACDHYHRWKDDVKLLKELGVNSYRFSISLARIYPTDEYTVNEKGVQFYKELVAELKRLNIEPIVTLYHWDMPMWLHERGGWKSETAIEWFERYTNTIVNALSDKVRYWLTFNEPQMFVGHGYRLGLMAPFECVSESEMKKISRNVMLAHGRAVRVIRSNAKISPKIGFSPAGEFLLPLKESDDEKAYEASFDIQRKGVYSAAWWCDPLLKGEAPNGCDWLTGEDLAQIYSPLDFCAFNIYFAAIADGYDYTYPGIPRTTTGGFFTPECMYRAVKYMYRRYGLPIMITENGMPNVDFKYRDGKVHDPQRCEFLSTYLHELKRVNDEGVPVIGYLYWSFMDNFEWCEGYDSRYGLVYVDYRTQERIPKDSFYSYREIIQTNGGKL